MGGFPDRTMGPLADYFGFSSSVAFWLCVAQLPLMIGLVLHYPTVRIDLFSTGVATVYDTTLNRTVVAATNQDAVHATGYEHGLGVSGLYVLNAASYTFFSVLTMNFLERGLALAEGGSSSSSSAGMLMVQQMGAEEFVAQNVGMVVDPTFRMWNQMYSASHLPVHRCVHTCACSRLE